MKSSRRLWLGDVSYSFNSFVVLLEQLAAALDWWDKVTFNSFVVLFVCEALGGKPGDALVFQFFCSFIQ